MALTDPFKIEDSVLTFHFQETRADYEWFASKKNSLASISFDVCSNNAD